MSKSKGGRRGSRVASQGGMRCDVDDVRRIVVLTFRGTITLDLLRSEQAQAPMHPRFDPSFPILFDYTRAEVSGLGPEDVRRIAENSPIGPTTRRALLVNDSAYALARLFRAHSQISGRGGEVEVFQDREEALRWLAK